MIANLYQAGQPSHESQTLEWECNLIDPQDKVGV